MTDYIAYEAHTARLEDFHRRAAEHRRASSVGVARRARSNRLATLLRGRRPAAETCSPSTA